LILNLIVKFDQINVELLLLF